MKPKVFLVGPFIGSLQWEYMYFVPYIIKIAKEQTDKKFIVFTRPTRFDLYGSYMDIFVPLKSKMTNEVQTNFTIEGFTEEKYKDLLKTFVDKYKYRYRILAKIYPEISYFSYKVKWQFPPSEMDYDFKPRTYNKVIAIDKMKQFDIFLDSNTKIKLQKLPNYNIQTSENFEKEIIKDKDYSKYTILGCTIEAIRRVKFIIGNLSSDISKLSLLLKIPLISIDERMTDDEIRLINPLNTPVIRCSSILEGIKIYENNF